MTNNPKQETVDVQQKADVADRSRLMPARGRLQGKSVVVIGGGQTPGVSTGIGRASALVFAREGADVFLVDRDEKSVIETRDEIVGEGGSATVHIADILDEESCGGIAATADKQMGGIDVLFNTVGRASSGKAGDMSSDDWDSVMDLNLKAAWMVTKHVLPIMQRQSSGSIIHISSIFALRDGALRQGRSAGYAVSKAALDRLVIALASGYAQYDIRANSIQPGTIDTPMAVDQWLAARGMTRDEVVAERQAPIPMNYVATAFDIAYAALFLASDESRYVTGQRLAVDGGLTST